MTAPGDPGSTRRERRRRFRRVPVRIIVPNLVTLLALSLGLTAIRFAAEQQFERAVYAIVAAAVLDGVDGRLARAIKGTSRFGAELDSLADFVDFGVAPALTLYFWSLEGIKSFGWFAAMVFAIACALRLARFNVALENLDAPAWTPRFFTGMPAPAGAIAVLLPLYLQLSGLELGASRPVIVAEAVYVLAIAALMASRIPHFSGKQVGRIPREQVIVVLFAVVVVVLLLATFPLEMLTVLTVAYLAAIPVGVLQFRRLAAQGTGPAALPDDDSALDV